MRNVLLVLAALCGLAGVGLVAAAAVAARTEASFRARAGHAVGVVDDIEISERGSGPVGCPIVRFAPPHGQSSTFVDEGCGNPPPHRKDDHVPVLYDPAEPSHAHIDLGDQPWARAQGPLGGGGVLLALAVGLVFLGRRMKSARG